MRARRGVSLFVVVAALVVLAALAVAVASMRRRVETKRQTSGASLRTNGVFPIMQPKPTPVANGFQGCPPQGDGGDPALNFLKNRTDSAAWVPVPLDSVVALPWPHAVERRRRADWSRADSAAVARYEGLPISVEGYFAGSKQEGPESCNCHGADKEFRDWHLWLTSEPTPDRSHSVVVETTPSVRAMRAAWELATIRKLVRDKTPVRVSGWLMLDPEHPDQVGKTRGTIWEIHPIMQIEVKQLGRWVALDNAR